MKLKTLLEEELCRVHSDIERLHADWFAREGMFIRAQAHAALMVRKYDEYRAYTKRYDDRWRCIVSENAGLFHVESSMWKRVEYARERATVERLMA